MSNSKMLIDAAHPEETRVVVLKGNRVEEFDFESASKKQLRGNIYLAKVTRVEPSLQAAFIEYGGNRHGFLAFSEIHPDYYQIPFADRQALLEEEARAHRDEDDEGRGGGEGRGGESRGGEGRGNGEGRSRDNRRNAGGNGEGGERSARGDGRGEGRGDRGGRSDRNERGQRRSRRHRRDQVPATALDSRGANDESISEPVALGDEDLTTSFDTAAPGDAGTTDATNETQAFDSQASENQGFDGQGSESRAVPGDASSDEADRGTVDAQGAAGEPLALVEAAPSDAPVIETAAGSESPAALADEAPAASDAQQPALTEAGEPVALAVEAETVAEAPADAEPVAPQEQDHDTAATAASFESHGDDESGAEQEVEASGHEAEPARARDSREHQDDEGSHADHEEEHVEQIGGDALSDVAPRPTRLRRHYKIQEVIKRRQILLIQVVKEERGNKGAALTTYLSLAGRYSVLMPNTAKGGGISRKITDGEDRKRLKAIAGELDVPEGMGVILRTAGASRSPIEVKRDFEYLLRMWESVRELTLKSSAPTLVYEEGSLIKRSIRDLYSKEVEEIVVSGEAGFAEARDFMRMLMPGNVKSVQLYRDPQPIFAKSGVEAQLDAMFSPHVTLKSGGYLVINQTEALVAIDVNSGRSTREHNIEDTALRTNLEAADEVARQLRLRDLAGLIVVDFIDMEEGRNNRAVERRIKEALKNDRARIQIGRISHFGLLEMSRQRIRTGVLEGSTVVCPHCAGAGTVRSTASIALHVLRLVEDALLKDASYDLIVRSRAEVALYMLNQKRAKLVELEQRFGVSITVAADPTLTGMVYHAIERGELATPAIAPAPRQDLVRVDSIAPIFEPGSEIEESFETADQGDEPEAETAEDGTEAASAEQGDGEGRRRKRRRRRRGRDRDASAGEAAGDSAEGSEDGVAAQGDEGDEGEDAEPVSSGSEPAEAEVAPSSPITGAVVAEAVPAEVAEAEVQPEPVVVAPIATAEAEPAAEEAPKRRRSRRTAARIAQEGEAAAEVPAVEAVVEEDAPARPRRRRPSRARATEASPEASPETPSMTSPAAEAAPASEAVESLAAPEAMVQAATEVEAPSSATPAVETEAAPAPRPVEAETAPAEQDPDRPKRSGWWQRAKASFGS
jgi:ribonuclease E